MIKQLKNPGNIQTVLETQLEKMITNIEDGKLYGQHFVGGIPCKDKEKTEALLTVLQKERKEILTQKEKFEAQGLAFEAIVPRSFFNKIITKNGLFSFKHIVGNHDEKSFWSETGYDNNSITTNLQTSFKGVIKRINRIFVAIFIATLCSILYVNITYAAILMKVLNLTTTTGYILTSIAFWVIILFIFADMGKSESGGQIGFRCYSRIKSLLISIATRRSVKVFFNKDFKGKLFSNKKDVRIHTDRSNAVKLVLYPAPETTKNRLNAWIQEGYTLHTVCDKKAFSISSFEAKRICNVFARELHHQYKVEEQIELEIRRQKWNTFLAQFHFNLDPISYCEIQNSNYNAIVAAYGTKFFMSEDEVMSQITEYYSHRLAEFQPNLN